MPDKKSRRLAILIVAQSRGMGHKGALGHSAPCSSNDECMDYVELLSASNYCFDIVNPKDISTDTIMSGDAIHYTSIVFTIPLASLPDQTISVIREASHTYGVSLLASYTHVDNRTMSLFGIRKQEGKRVLWPLKVNIVHWPGDEHRKHVSIDYGMKSGITGIRKRCINKLNFKQTFIKGMRHLKNSIVSYAQVEPEQNTRTMVADLNGRPLAWAYRYGSALNYYFAIDNNKILSKFNEMHRLIRSTIEANSGHGMVSVNLDNTMALRLDDPGACAHDYRDAGGLLDEAAWENVGKFLAKKEIPVSVMYTPCWVDDGAERSGRLFIDDKEIHDRKAGALYESSRVTYVPANDKYGKFDHASEFRGLKKLARDGHADIHSHGLTHADPDYASWVDSPDRATATGWCHEFYDVRKSKKIDASLQKKALRDSRSKIKNLFDSDPCAFTPSGHMHDAQCDVLARDAGYKLFSADYTGIVKNGLIVRNWKIPSIFLYLKSPSHFSRISGYPFIGVIHDYEIKSGMDEFECILGKWTACGISQFISLTEMTVSLCSTITALCSERESKVTISIGCPENSIPGRTTNRFEGSRINLRAHLPHGMKFKDTVLSISGATLVSAEQPADDRAVNVNIRLGNAPVVNISIGPRI